MDFETREDVIVWMIDNQDGRRNLSDYSRTRMHLKKEDAIRAKAKAKQGERTDILLNSVKCQEGKPLHTDVEIAKSANVGKDTVQKVRKIEATAIPEVKEQAERGLISVNAAATIATLPAEKQRAKHFY